MQKSYKRIGAVCLWALLVLSLLPIVILGFYNHPTGDDYYYGAEAHRAFVENGSAASGTVAAVTAAIKGVAHDYQNWQGTYSAMFLMRLQPTVFGESGYHWVTAVIVLLLVSGIFYLLKVLLEEVLGVDRADRRLISGVLALLAVQTVPTASESLYWYNGSMYYTGYLAVTLWFWGFLIRAIRKNEKKRFRKIVDVAVSILLAGFLAGGNYISLLPCMILLVLLETVLIWRKEKSAAMTVGLATLAMLVGFGINALAPGNAVRQSGMWQIPAWKAVAKALVQGLRYMRAWIGLWWIGAALLLTPVFLRMYRKITFSFPYPLVVAGLLYGVFCSMSCPVFYTMNSTGPARVVAICYYGFVLFGFAAYWYVLGYVYRKVSARRTAEARERKQKTAEWVMIGAACLLFAAQSVNGSLAQCTAGKALASLLSGEAAGYQAEYEARLALLEEEASEVVVLAPFVNRPSLLYVGDLSQDPQEPTNVKVALFYGKKSVSVSCAEP